MILKRENRKSMWLFIGVQGVINEEECLENMMDTIRNP